MSHHLLRTLVTGVVLTATLLAAPLGSSGAAPAALSPTDLTGTIAFVCEHDEGENDEICLMDADGSGRTRLTDSPGPDRAPSWDPAGERLVFNSRRDDHADRPQIYQLDVASGAVTRISDGPLEDQRASWTPDGGSVVFQRGTFATGFELQRQDLATGTVTTLTDDPGRLNAAGSFAPDGVRLLHQSNRDAAGLFPFGTYITDTGTGTTSRLAESVTASHDGPRWSPTADRVAFSAGGALHIVDVATGEVDQVTDGTWSDSAPAWSPDGSMLVFQSDRTDPDDTDDVDIITIHVIDLASGEVVTLGEGRTPVWSDLDRSPSPGPEPSVPDTTVPTDIPDVPAPTDGVSTSPDDQDPTRPGAVTTEPPAASPIPGRPAFTG